jgi:hypothetical protein
VARLDSELGTASFTLVAPAVVAPAVRSDSELGTASFTLTAPGSSTARSDSAFGEAPFTLTVPHRPIVMRTATGYHRTVVRMRTEAGWSSPPSNVAPFPDAFFPDTAYPA